MSNKLQMAYNARKASGKSGGGRVGCVDCMAKGGRCGLHDGGATKMAEGGLLSKMSEGKKEEPIQAKDIAEQGQQKGYGQEISWSSQQQQPGKYARGGEVENRKLDPDAAVEMPDDMQEDIDLERRPGSDQSDVAKLAMATGGLVDAIMKDRERRKMAEGGLVDADASPDYDKRVDLEPVHTREDEEHELTSPSLDDESLVGQILSERKMKRRG